MITPTNPRYIVVMEVVSPIGAGMYDPKKVSKEIKKIITKYSPCLYVKQKDIIVRRLTNAK